MIKSRFLFLAIAAVVLASCASAPVPPPTVTPQGEDRFLLDPRVGSSADIPEASRQLDAAWRFLLAGDTTTAATRLAAIRTKYPAYLPATLAEAAIEIHNENFQRAQVIVNDVLGRQPSYTAARVYAAEIALRQRHLRAAYDLYAQVARDASLPPEYGERIEGIRRQLFEEALATARTAEGVRAEQLAREALALQPESREAQLLLARQLVAAKKWDEARRVLEAAISSGDADRTDVQEMLAEIDAGRGRYQEAIARYERLARRESDPRFARRLEAIKEEWNAANMPPQFRRALESEAITRADLAVLLYWGVPSIRFAQNVGVPPIAVDISEVAGREEIVRAIALGVLQVDPVTRRVGPGALVNAASLSRYAARVLLARGADCARAVPPEAESIRAEKILAACRVTSPALTMPAESAVAGRAANTLVEQLDRALSSR